MALNNAAFGDLVLNLRGDLTQEEIAARGGPPRQRLSQIEFGDPVELTAGVMSQLDTAFGWGAGATELRLTPVRRPVHLRMMLAALKQSDLLGVSERERVPAPPVLAVDEAIRMLPIAAHWPGPVLIDVGGHTETSRDSALQEWIERAGAIDGVRLRRAGLDDPADAVPIAIDPFGAIRSTRAAAELLERIEVYNDASENRTVETRPRWEYRDAAATVLFIAAEAARRGCDGLNVLSGLVSKQLDSGLDQAWREFHRSTGLSNRRDRIDRGVLELLRPLLALKDFHTNIVLQAGEDDQLAGTVVVDEHVEVVTPASLAGSVVFYDAKMCPFLPVLFDIAYAGKALSPLVIAANRYPSLREAAPVAIPNSHLVAEARPGFDDPERAIAGAALVDFVAGSAVLVPDGRDGQKGAVRQRIWFADAAASVSNRHVRGSRAETDGVIEFFRQRRAEFGTFDTAELVGPDSSDEKPTLVLTDEHGKKLVLHWLSLGYEGGSGPEAAATILNEAGFGTPWRMKQLTERELTWPVTIARGLRPHELKLGTDLHGADLVIEISHGHTVIAGDDEKATEMLTTAIWDMRERLPATDLVVLGATTRAARPWAGVVGERALGFVAPGIGARDSAAVVRSLCAELVAEVHHRLRTLHDAELSTVDQYRAKGAVMPRLLIVLDGIDGPDDYWFNGTGDLIDAADMANRLDIRFLLCGKNPLPVMKWLDARRNHDDTLPAFAFKAAVEDVDPDVALELIGEPGGQGPERDGYVWGFGAEAATPFRLDQRADGST